MKYSKHKRRCQSGGKKHGYEEQYLVRFARQNADGLWDWGVEEVVRVPENGTHDDAEKVIRKKYPGCKVIGVWYV